MFENLFRFPMIRGDQDDFDAAEKEARIFNTDMKVDPDLIYGEAECPYFDFVCISDIWIPTEKSRAMARKGRFNHCFVTFGNCGSYTVPWSREQFKEEFNKFVESLPKKNEVVIELKPALANE